jgi:hypothetical protein
VHAEAGPPSIAQVTVSGGVPLLTENATLTLVVLKIAPLEGFEMITTGGGLTL